MKSAGYVRFISHKGKQVLLVVTTCTPEEVKSVATTVLCEARGVVAHGDPA